MLRYFKLVSACTRINCLYWSLACPLSLWHHLSQIFVLSCCLPIVQDKYWIANMSNWALVDVSCMILLILGRYILCLINILLNLQIQHLAYGLFYLTYIYIIWISSVLSEFVSSCLTTVIVVLASIWRWPHSCHWFRIFLRFHVCKLM